MIMTWMTHLITNYWCLIMTMSIPVVETKGIVKKVEGKARVVVQWLAHAPLIEEARVRFSPEAGHLGKVFSDFPSPSR